MDSFAALADPTRRQIVEALAGGEQSFGALAERFSISRPAVSQHLKVLKDAGIVVARAEAQRRIYSLDADAFSELNDWLERVSRYWNPRLDRLQRVLTEDAEDASDD